MRVAPSVLLALYAGMTSTFAQDQVRTCLVFGPPYQLASDMVEWRMVVGRGQGCIRGVRTAFVTLDSIRLAAPPQAGRIKLEGPGFLYQADSEFRGEDSFTMVVSGKLSNVSGSSTIRVLVSVR
jgi:hypothetical protein